MLKIINKLILTSLIYCAGCYFTTSLWAVEIQVNITDINASNIKDIIVTATPEKLKPSEPLPAIIINQINKAFFPYLSVIRKGQKVIFKNNDDITHHIFSTSRINMALALLFAEASTACGKSMMTGPYSSTSTLNSDKSP